MQLPVEYPLKPMLAKRVDKIPAGDGWLFEPKWDGFRALVFCDGDDLRLQSRDLKPLNRYFPELESPLRACLPRRCVLDGEIVIATDGRLDFEALLARIHPAASRVAKLAAELPSSFVAWDILCHGDDDLRELAFSARREHLESALASARPPVYMTPITTDATVAQDWFSRFEGAGFDGVMAKPAGDSYQPNKRAMLKVKHKRTADCVVAGFRWHKNGPGTMVGSLLLGLHDDEGRLHHVGVAASFKTARRQQLVDELAPYRDNAAHNHPWHYMIENPDSAGLAKHRQPGAVSRWSKGKGLAWEPLRPELVVEVSYDHMQGDRFRHTTHFVRWRPDKPPTQCNYAQLDVTPAIEIAEIFK